MKVNSNNWEGKTSNPIWKLSVIHSQYNRCYDVLPYKVTPETGSPIESQKRVEAWHF